jgi:predicted metalloprotease with PDZ domain
MRLFSLAARAAALTVLAAGTLPAQDNSDRPRGETPRPAPRVSVWRAGDDDGIRLLGPLDQERQGSRAVLGVSTSSGGVRDTLGLLITSITAGGPADRAGLEEGNRIAAINGTNLRLSSVDAGESDMQGMVSRRLTRELGKVKPGDQVELRVWQNGQYRTMRVRTIAADSLPGRRVSMAGLSREARDREREARAREREDRAVLGLDLQPTGSRRDTLGVLITRVADGSPAERAGLVEGDRVAAVNGVDLRVSRDDAGDGWASNAKSNRFSREMQRVKAGDAVELRVYSNGQYKTVRVNAARAGDVYKDGRNTMFFRNAFFDGELVVPPMPRCPPPRPSRPGPSAASSSPRRHSTSR